MFKDKLLEGITIFKLDNNGNKVADYLYGRDIRIVGTTLKTYEGFFNANGFLHGYGKEYNEQG